MPRMDGTGPEGTGPIGRGLGPCGGGQSGRFARGWGRGFRRGGGYGWGMRYMSTPEEEISLLEQQKSWLETQIEALNKRLSGPRQSDENEK